MAFIKLKANEIFTGTQILGEGNVLIVDEDGTVQDLIPEDQAGDDIQRIDGLLTPGFINCHCHLELSHMKGLIPEKTGLIDFVFKVVTQRHFAEDEILESIANAENEMLENGIVAVGDICNNTFTLPQKKQGNLHYYNFVECSGWLPEIAETRFIRSKSYYDQFLKSTPATSIVPHAPYSVSAPLWQEIKPFFKDKVVSIHNQETSFEDELFLRGSGDFVRMYEMMKIDNSFFKPSGKSSLQTYFPKLKEAGSVILVHNTFTTVEDIRYASEMAFSQHQLLSFCLCVNANQYIENHSPPIELLRINNCNIVLGTDSLASNRTLNILDEMKTIQRNYPAVPFSDLLQYATLNGAKALQMEEILGSFEKGKKPGICIITGINNGQLTEDSMIKRCTLA